MNISFSHVKAKISGIVLKKGLEVMFSPQLSTRLSSVAKCICELGNWNISNLRLQKILYICHMIYLGRTGKPLIDDNFEAWMYGPVVPALYQKMKVFGAGPVSDRFYNAEQLPEDIEDTILEIYPALKQLNDSELISITHMDGSAWSKLYQRGKRGIVIKNEDIIDEYRTRSA